MVIQYAGDEISQVDGEWDYVIVGGGSAGCVLAGRLSENSAVRVLLLEAGPDYGPDSEPESVRDGRYRSNYVPDLFWPGHQAQYTAGYGEASTPRLMNYKISPKLLGGGSAINGMHAQRGTPDDYNEWKSVVDGWSWEDVLPFFKRMENDRDFHTSEHGNSGPLPVQRVKADDWSPISNATRDYFISRGAREIADVNSQFSDGVGPVPINISEGDRVSSAAAYLPPATRARANLRIVAGVRVTRVLLEGRKAVGVLLERDGGDVSIRAGECIICCGTLFSPALLMRSGIGAAAALSRCGIDVVADRPGVGRNLVGHAMVNVSTRLRRSARQQSGHRPPCTNIVRYSSKYQDCPPTDMLVYIWERKPSPLALDPIGRHFANFMLMVNKAYSEGDVRLDPAHPAGNPLIRFNLLSDPRDRARLSTGVRTIAAMIASEGFRHLLTEAFFLRQTRMIAMMFENSIRALILSAAGALAMDGPSFFRRALLKNNIVPLVAALRDETVLEQLLDDIVSPAHHVGTCRLGRGDDAQAVVDERCRVIGVDGLRVVDASIFPTVMRGGTNIPVIMAAEKAADMIAEDRRTA